MRVLLIGDVVGRPGVRITTRAIPWLKQRHQLDVIIVNGENSAGGSGITPKIFEQLVAAGADAITLGDHIYRRREIYEILETRPNVVKPANYPKDAPGREWIMISNAEGVSLAVFSLLGRVFMKPVDCPWAAADRVLTQMPPEVKVRILDFHAEATSDKQLMGRYLDGRVSAVLGTHTHVPTADETIFPGGTAFQCDVGMTGPYESILGRRIDNVLQTTRTFRPTHFDVAKGDVRLSGTIVEVNQDSGKATSIERLTVTEDEVDQAVSG